MRIIPRNPTKIYTIVKINGPIMPNFNFNQSDILYMMPREIKKYINKSEFALLIALEPHTLETMEVLEILLLNFETAEEYEYCSVLKKEIDFRVETYRNNGEKEEEEEESGQDLPVQD